MDNFQIIGAIKIKDGLFMGDEYSAQDLDFMLTNKITHIVNCAGKQIPNIWESVNLLYFTLPWLENDSQIIFDDYDRNLGDIYSFIESARMKGEGCLVHSLKGLSRSCCVLAAYFMKKFKWTLYKTLEFLHSRRPDLEIRSSFFTQLKNLENKLSSQGLIKYNSWEELNEDPIVREEELIIRNTFLNSKQKKPSLEEFIGKKKPSLNRSYTKKISLSWIDEVYRDRSKLVTEIKPFKMTNLKIKSKNIPGKPILKYSNSAKAASFLNSFLNQNNKANMLKTLNGFNIGPENNNTNNNNGSLLEFKGRFARPSTPTLDDQTKNKNVNLSNESDILKNTSGLSESDIYKNIKGKNSRPPTPNPDNKKNNHLQESSGKKSNNVKESEFIPNKTSNNIKEVENSKSLITQLINKNPLLMRKKVNNYLEDNNSINNKKLPTSENNIKIDENDHKLFDHRSSSLPKKSMNNQNIDFQTYKNKRDIKDILNRSENNDEQDQWGKAKKPDKNGELSYQKLLFENGSHIKKQIQSKLLDEKNRKKGPEPIGGSFLSRDHKINNPGIGVGVLPGKRNNLLGNEKNNLFDQFAAANNNNNYLPLDSKFNPSQNSHLMSNLINLNLQLNKMNPKKEKPFENSENLQQNPSNYQLDHMININNFNITTNQINNININLQKMLPIRATFEIKDQNNMNSYNQKNINIDIDKQSTINNSFSNTQNKSPNYSYIRNGQNKVAYPQFQQRSISPLTKELLKDNSNKQVPNNTINNNRLRSSSPAQNHGVLIGEEKYWGAQKPKWKF